MLEYNITTRRKDKGYQYIVSYKNEDGEWKQKSKQGFKLDRDAKAAAQKRVRKLEEEVESKKKIREEYKGKTFKEFKKMFIRHVSLHREGNTIHNYDTAFAAFDSLDDKAMIEIEPADIQECVDKMIEKGLKSSTILTYLGKIKAAFKYAVSPFGMIDESPVKDITVKKDKEKKEKRALTESERDDLLSKITDETYYMISMIAVKCGLREGEILGITTDIINFKTHMLHLHQQWKKLKTKDGYKYGFGALKSKKSYRDVHMAKDVEDELKQYMKCHPIGIDGRIFALTNLSGISGALSNAYKKAEYNDISLHNLRHTYATLLIQNGLDFETVAKLIGDNVKQVEETYAHVNRDMMKNAIAVIDRVM